MHIQPIDQYQDLFSVTDVVSSDLVQKILSTPWLELEFTKQQNQESWPRRLINNQQLEWFSEWEQQINQSWAQLEQHTHTKLQPYFGTAFWVDEPGFTCPIHTDGEMPGSLHLNWIGECNLGTTFYNSKLQDDVRYRCDFQPNSGYVMINMPDNTGYRHLQWHGMLEPVPANSYRLTSYIWLIPIK